jgi:hypothetical protein
MESNTPMAEKLPYSSPVKTYRIKEIKYSNGSSKFIPQYCMATNREKIKFFYRQDLWLNCIGVPESYKDTLEACKQFIEREKTYVPVTEIGEVIHNL